MPNRAPAYDRTRWQIERERFQLPPEPPVPAYRVSTPQAVLPKVLKGMGLEKALWEQTLVQEWGELVGPQIARQTRPARLDRGILQVYVSHSAWLTELQQFGQQAMLDKLQTRFGRTRIKGIRLQLDPDPPGSHHSKK